MDFDVSTLGPCRKKVSVTISPDRIQEAFDKKYDEINDNVALPGFRRGRAPRRLLEKRFSDKLGDEVKEELVKAAMEQLVDDKKVEPLAAPEIDIEALELDPSSEMKFEFELVTKPEFETPKYAGLEVKVPPVEVTTEHEDNAIDDLRRRSATLENADTTVDDGDVLILDWEARDGDSIESQDTNVYYPFGRGVLAGFVVEGFDDQLRGKKVGAEATATVQVAADDPREELRGRELALTATLKEVKRYVLPEIDEAFLKQHDYDDADELRADMNKQLTRAMKRNQERDAETRLVDQIVDAVEIELPEEFVERELETWAQRKRMSLQVENVAEDEIAKAVDADADDAKSSIEQDMRKFFLLDRIADEEEIEATEADMSAAIQEMAMAYGRPFEEIAGSFRDPNRLSELRTMIRHRKARERMRTVAKIVEDASLAEPKKAAKKKAAKKKPAAKKKAAKKKAAKKKTAK